MEHFKLHFHVNIKFNLKLISRRFLTLYCISNMAKINTQADYNLENSIQVRSYKVAYYYRGCNYA